MNTLLLLVLGASLILLALFAASEAALAATNRVRLRHLLRTARPDLDSSGEIHSSLSDDLSGDTRRFLATVTIAANIPLMTAAAAATILARSYWRDPATASAAVIGASLIAVPFFQVAPRLLVSRRGSAERLWWVGPARLLVALLGPIVEVLLWLGELMLRPLGLSGARSRNTESNEDEIRE